MPSIPLRLFILLWPLLGCSTLGKIGQVLMDPEIPVGAPGSQPSTLGIALVADETLNPGREGQANPLELQIVRLSEESRLLSADYQQLRQDLAKALGKNYLDHQDYTLTPAEFRYLPSFPMDEQTRYLGVIAHYADPERAQWRQLIRIDPLGHHYQLLVHLHSDRILLQREDE